MDIDMIALVCAWVVGLFTSTFSHFIEWHTFKKRKFLKAINCELEEIQVKFIILSYRLRTTYYIDEIDEEYMQYLKEFYKRYNGQNIHPDLIKYFLDSPFATVHETKKYYKSSKASNNSSNLDAISTPKISLYYITSRLELLQNLDDNKSREIFNIIQQIEQFNDTIDLNHHYLNETFNDNLSEPNKVRIHNNLSISYKSIKDRSENIADTIERSLKNSLFVSKFGNFKKPQ